MRDLPTRDPTNAVRQQPVLGLSDEASGAFAGIWGYLDFFVQLVQVVDEML